MKSTLSLLLIGLLLSCNSNSPIEKEGRTPEIKTKAESTVTHHRLKSIYEEELEQMNKSIRLLDSVLWEIKQRDQDLYKNIPPNFDSIQLLRDQSAGRKK